MCFIIHLFDHPGQPFCSRVLPVHLDTNEQRAQWAELPQSVPFAVLLCFKRCCVSCGFSNCAPTSFLWVSQWGLAPKSAGMWKVSMGREDISCSSSEILGPLLSNLVQGFQSSGALNCLPISIHFQQQQKKRIIVCMSSTSKSCFMSGNPDVSADPSCGKRRCNSSAHIVCTVQGH